MYTRSFGKLETDGQLLKLKKERERELLKDLTLPPAEPTHDEPLDAPACVQEHHPQHNPQHNPPHPHHKKPASQGLLGNLFGGIFNSWSLDDLILAGLTLYLLNDKDESNDLLVILLVLLLT